MAYEDQEQLDAIKKWWQENQWFVIGGVLAVAIGFGGYSFWKSNQAAQNLAASEQFQAYSSAITAEDKAIELAKLQEQFSGQTYASLASLSTASQAVADGDLESAETALRWVSDNADSELKGLADIRLAKVLWEMDKVNQALTVLDSVESAYQAQAFELKGDIYSSQNQWADAVMAYEQAMGLDSLIFDKTALQLKLDFAKSAG